MNLSTTGLSLTADSAIDLHLHTVYSDGVWQPEQLLDYLAGEAFDLAAVADHDRVDTLKSLQQMALERRLPSLVAVEMTTVWKGEMTDVLCYGFDPEENELSTLAQSVVRRQQENTLEACEYLRNQGYPVFHNAEEEERFSQELAVVLETPSAQQPHALGALLMRTVVGPDGKPLGKILMQAGIDFAKTDIAQVADAVHRSGGVCLIAHPGRGDGFMCFDVPLLDELRTEVAFDGLEVCHPLLTPAQTEMYREYAQRHHLLVSAGSDSHKPEKPPIKYRAELCRGLLERLGIQVR